MRLFLVRHTKVNIAKGICYGKSDISLAKTFEKEKNVILSKLTNIKFDYIYSSPLQRCKLLAQELTDAPYNIIFDKRLKELDFGLWEGKPWNEIEKTDEAKYWFKDYLNTSCPEGESYNILLNRVQDFLFDLNMKKADKNVLIVTHGGIIRAFHSIINRVHPDKAFDLKPDFGQIFEF